MAAPGPVRERPSAQALSASVALSIVLASGPPEEPVRGGWRRTV